MGVAQRSRCEMFGVHTRYWAGSPWDASQRARITLPYTSSCAVALLHCCAAVVQTDVVMLYTRGLSTYPSSIDGLSFTCWRWCQRSCNAWAGGPMGIVCHIRRLLVNAGHTVVLLLARGLRGRR